MTRRNKTRLSFGIIMILLILGALVVPGVLAAPPNEAPACTEEYIVQANDWLSKIADKYYGNVLAYPAIVSATTQQFAADPSFANITNPNAIEIGWKICLPSTDAVETLLASSNNSITLTDALNRQVTLPQPPQRIVVAGKSIFMLADAVYMFPDAKKREVSMPSGGQSVTDFLALVEPAYSEKFFLESNAGPEQIVAAKPEVVILKSFMAQKLGNPLEQLGVPVVYIDLETPEQYGRDIAILGQLLGNQNRAQELIDFYNKQVAKVEQLAAQVTEKPRVLVLQHTTKGGEVAFNVAPASWIQTTMVTKAGGAPVWTDASLGDGWAVVNFEQIAAWNPDQIYIINYTDDPVQVVADLKANPQWQALKAVQANQIYPFPKDFYSWDQPDSRWILGQLWLAAKIQPDAATQIDLMKEVSQFYTFVYGLDEATVQAKVLPMLKGLP